MVEFGHVLVLEMTGGKEYIEGRGAEVGAVGLHRLTGQSLHGPHCLSRVRVGCGLRGGEVMASDEEYCDY